MTSKYTIPSDPITGEPSKTTIIRLDDDGKEWFIPTDPANSDYQRYLNPEAEQSTPIVAAE
jgi:hypothetical protein